MPKRVGNKKAAPTRRKSTIQTSKKATSSVSRGPKRKAKPKVEPEREPTHVSLDAFATSAELSELIECAFAELNDPEASIDMDKRETPRVSVEDAKPLLIVSYNFMQEEHRIDTRATLADVSADGMGLVVTTAIPVGAAIRFALADENGEPTFGFARVERTAKLGKKYWIGVSFVDPADSLEVPCPTYATENPTPRSSAGDGSFGQLQRKVELFARRILGGYRALRTISRCDGDNRATFRIEAKLLGYVASLDVNGVRVAYAAWPIRSGSKKLTSNNHEPTFVQLEGDGFRANATVTPGTIVSCEIEPGTGASRQRCVQGAGFDIAPLNIDLGPMNGQTHEQLGAATVATSC